MSQLFYYLSFFFLFLFLPDGTGYVEDGREIFDDDLDDDVVEDKRGKHKELITFSGVSCPDQVHE